ncbi:LexA repressor [Paenibacillus dokdonensis]|uniref:LexA repressor n=1 Tax=Paenibacillus dokdonensis TaxID=2567944 RepID=A0ABU6GQF6_9BACL|nr:MarR family transcriptional regulator [Paenibacillus dokdonensis]MEC0241959.1 LexA repressor [Paenibacillus dokdonensis]
MEPLTKRQGDVLAAIGKFIDSNKYPPSVRELSDMMGHASSSTTHSMLTALEKKGYIHREVSKPRTLKVLGQA